MRHSKSLNGGISGVLTNTLLSKSIRDVSKLGKYKPKNLVAILTIFLPIFLSQPASVCPAKMAITTAKKMMTLLKFMLI